MPTLPVSSLLPRTRAKLADVWVPRLAPAIRRVLTRHYEEGVDYYEQWEDLLPDDALFLPRWAKELTGVQMSMALAMVKEGWRLAEVELTGSKEVLMALIAGKADGTPTLGFDSQEIVDNMLRPNVENYYYTTGRIEGETTRRRLAQTIIEYRDKGALPGYIAKKIRARIPDITRARSEMIARTATIWNFNEGAQGLYKRSGITVKEWLVTDDDLTCEFCITMQISTEEGGRQMLIDSSFFAEGDLLHGAEGGTLEMPFNIDHPPLHPNCRCALIPVTLAGGARVA